MWNYITITALTPQSSMGIAPGVKNPAQKGMSQYLQTLLKVKLVKFNKHLQDYVKMYLEIKWAVR